MQLLTGAIRSATQARSAARLAVGASKSSLAGRPAGALLGESRVLLVEKEDSGNMAGISGSGWTERRERWKEVEKMSKMIEAKGVMLSVWKRAGLPQAHNALICEQHVIGTLEQSRSDRRAVSCQRMPRLQRPSGRSSNRAFSTGRERRGAADRPERAAKMGSWRIQGQGLGLWIA
jgi:hypothetical protein